MKCTGLKLSAVVFLAVALMHLLRVIFKIQVIVGDYLVPIWLSVFGFFFAFALFLWIVKILKEGK